MPTLLPQGMQKREALDRLYENLAEFSTTRGGEKEDNATDRRLFIESAARIFKLDASELQQEWNKRYQKKDYVPLYASSPSPEEGSFSQELGFEDPYTADPNLPKNTQKKLNPYSQGLIHCERQLLLELLAHPKLFGYFQEELSKLSFEDPHSEFLWRHLESRYLLGKIWSKDKPVDLELPEETHNIFSSLIAKRQFEQNEQGSSPAAAQKLVGKEEIETEIKGIIEDYLLKHDKLEHEKDIDEIGSRISVTDPLQKSQLLAEEGKLIRELNHLKDKQRRGGEYSPSTEASQK